MGGRRHFHPGQLADERLELVDALECALAHLGLVRGVGGRELRAADDLAHDGGNQVAVHAGPEEADVRRAVASREPRELGANLLLGHGRRQVPAGGTDRGGDIGEEVIDRRHPDRLEHAPAVGIGVRGVGHAEGRSDGLGGVRAGVEERVELPRFASSTRAIQPSPNGSALRSSGDSRRRVVHLDDLAEIGA
jgi:hypothetical protein